jgi:hypothetical protein
MPLLDKSEEQEVKDLIPWIAESIDVLNEKLNLEIEINAKEHYEKDVRLDLIGTDHISQLVTIIEVQAGKSDHWYLGKLITYAATREAGIIIWIAHEFEDIHKRAIEWLNATCTTLEFYGVELRLAKDDEALLAPHFNVIAGPPTSKRSDTTQDTEVSSLNTLYLNFFEKVRDKILSKQPDFTHAKVLPQSWWSIGIGKPGFSLSSCFTMEDMVRVELYVDTGISKYNEKVFNQLKTMKYRIEQQIRKELMWEHLPDSNTFRIYTAINATIDDEQEKLNQIADWTATMLMRFKDVFSPLVNRIKFED